jgi:RNA polymerase sigma-70 factor (ECF subfamily)
MSVITSTMTGRERALLDTARRGDEDAFRALVEPHRRELHAHCYQILGSVHDAEAALQDALLRAWRGLPGFEARRSLRPWLYKIATNTSLDVIGKRPKRMLPVDYGPPSEPRDGPSEPLVESVWVEPYPDERLGVDDGPAAPEARYERRESVELAFIAALQHLPANQRAVLILREVLGFSAQETAETLDTSVPSVNSALQRARKTVDDKLPDQSQQATLRTLGDAKLQEIVDRYVDALDSADVDTVVGMLTEDASWSMPPAASWFQGREELRTFLSMWPLSGEWRWRRLPTRANGQPAVAAYTWDEAAAAFLPFALDVLSFRGDRISDVTAFITRTIDLPDQEALGRWPEQAPDDRRTESVFARFGLPASLPAG